MKGESKRQEHAPAPADSTCAVKCNKIGKNDVVRVGLLRRVLFDHFQNWIL